MTAYPATESVEAVDLRPEARPVPFPDLDEQQRGAFLTTVDLLFGAAESITTGGPGRPGPPGPPGSGHLPTRSILMDGERGTGKTTLMLTLAEALKADRYGAGAGEWFDLDRLPEPASRRLRLLRNRLVWLETLDMEPLTDEVNLLGAMLARLEEALDVPALEEPPSVSLLSPGTEYQEAVRALARLQTAVVRAFPGHTGSRAQGSDPDTHAVNSRSEERDRLRLGRSFREVLAQLSRALHGRRHLHTPLFVLPVDDLDLNVGKSLALLRLLRVAQSPHLIVIMAADLRLLSMILRLQYQGEFARIAGPVALADDDRRMAGDLAADLLRKHLPQKQRVRLAAADPSWALNYRPHAHAPRLRNLLGELRLPADRADLVLDSRLWPRDTPSDGTPDGGPLDVGPQDGRPQDGRSQDRGRTSSGALLPVPADRRIRAILEGYSWPEVLRVPARQVVDLYLCCHTEQQQPDLHAASVDPVPPGEDLLRRYVRDRLDAWRNDLPPGRDEADFTVRAETDRPPPQAGPATRVVSRRWSGWSVHSNRIPLPSKESAALVGCFELAGAWDRPWRLRPYCPPLRESHLPAPSGGEPFVLGWPWVSHSTFWGYERAVKWLRRAEEAWAGQPYHLFGSWIAVMTAQLFDVAADPSRLLDEPTRPVAGDWPALRARLDDLPDTGSAREWHLAIGLLCTPEMGMDDPGALPVPVIPPDLADERDGLRATRGLLPSPTRPGALLPGALLPGAQQNPGHAGHAGHAGRPGAPGPPPHLDLRDGRT